jgi:hypothetical protein
MTMSMTASPSCAHSIQDFAKGGFFHLTLMLALYLGAQDTCADYEKQSYDKRRRRMLRIDVNNSRPPNDILASTSFILLFYPFFFLVF